MLKEIKYNGFTASPDDYACPDGDLATMAGLSRDHSLVRLDGAMEMFDIPTNLRIVRIHKTGEYTHYLFTEQGERGYWLWWKDGEEVEYTQIEQLIDGEVYKIEPIGNTLVVLAESGVHYLLWKDGEYHYLGDHLPELDLEFSLLGGNTGAGEEIGIEDGIALADLQNKKEYYVDIATAIQAATNKATYNAQSHGMAIYPFWVRYGYRLYDGETVTMQSAPILMSIPEGAVKATMKWSVTDGKVSGIRTDRGNIKGVEANVNGYLLFYRMADALQKTALENWSDIVDRVVIYVSPQFPTIDLDVEEKKIKFGESEVTFPANERWRAQLIDNSSFHYITEFSIEQLGNNVYDSEISSRRYGASIGGGVNAMNTAGYCWVKPECELRNEIVVSRPAMPDDYHSHDHLLANDGSSVYGFNGRLNLAHMSRRLFEGFPACCLWHEVRLTEGSSASEGGHHGWATTRETGEETLHNNAVPCTITVVVADDNGREVTMQSRESGVEFFDDTKIVWYYYPSPKAKRAYFDVNGTVYEIQLKKHPTLYGSYYCNLDEDAVQPEVPSVPELSTDEERIVDIPGRLYTSEVNNPFYFPMSGVNTIGAGEILGICAAVKAMSQGQFGQYPLYCFTTEGVWALQTKSDGTWGAITPTTRDVCVDADSITQLDDSVLFATARGIMLISGSTSQCISEVIDGRVGFSLDMMTEKANNLKTIIGDLAAVMELATFERFRDGMRMLYDYRHQNIIVYNDTMESGAKKYPYAYVYAMKQQLWSVMVCDLVDHINSYPDAMAVTTEGRLVNLSEDTLAKGLVPFVLMTRPIDLGAPDVHKTITAILQRGVFEKSHLQQVLFGSRDMIHWHVVSSSANSDLRGYNGTPYKWFRLLVMGALGSGESITGMTVQYETRLMNRPR